MILEYRCYALCFLELLGKLNDICLIDSVYLVGVLIYHTLSKKTFKNIMKNYTVVYCF